jgi:hypothetical protein
MLPNIILYTVPPDIRSGGITNFFLFFEICKKKHNNTFLCPILKDIPSLRFNSPFNDKSIDEITQQEINNYFNIKNDNSKNYNLEDCIINLDILKRRDNIVIYPEDVLGNPAEQKYVVRWLLFFPNQNAIKSYSFDKDYICFFSEYIFNLYDNLCKNVNIYNYMKYKIKTPNILRVFHFKKNYYKNLKKKRSGKCILIRKCYPPFSFRKNEKIYNNYLTNIINENKKYNFENIDFGINHEEMISLFNEKELLLTYDPFTFTSVISALCGCKTVIRKIPNLSIEEWKKCDPFIKYGIAYGMDDIEEAMKTQYKLEGHIYNMYLENESNVENFIESIKKFFNFN